MVKIIKSILVFILFTITFFIPFFHNTKITFWDGEAIELKIEPKYNEARIVTSFAFLSMIAYLIFK